MVMATAITNTIYSRRPPMRTRPYPLEGARAHSAQKMSQ